MWAVTHRGGTTIDGVATVEWISQLMNRDCGYYLVALGTATDCMHTKLMCTKTLLPTHGAWVQVSATLMSETPASELN